MSAVPSPREMVDFIRRVFGWTQEALASRLDLDQATIHRWLRDQPHDRVAPHRENILRLTAWYHEARRQACFASTDPATLHYLCSFAKQGKYPSMPDEATATLRRSFPGPRTLTPANSSRSLSSLLDISVRAVPLSDDIKAHCFADDPDNPSTIIILVNDRLSRAEQLRTARDEFYAHLESKLAFQPTHHRHGRRLLRRRD